MRKSAGEYLPSVLNLMAGIAVLAISFRVEIRIPASAQVAKQAGVVVVALGMGLVIWSAFHLRGAFLGEVAPTREDLVRSGPYRFIRHPVYLGMTVALAGVAVSLRSWPGLIAVLSLFLPSEIYRAKLEEEALRKRHGADWEAYADETGFLLPFL
jgi:protein-S-isoprenylcysteine O-methyltransferase Ste14